MLEVRYSLSLHPFLLVVVSAHLAFVASALSLVQMAPGQLYFNHEVTRLRDVRWETRKKSSIETQA